MLEKSWSYRSYSQCCRKSQCHYKGPPFSGICNYRSSIPSKFVRAHLFGKIFPSLLSFNPVPEIKKKRNQSSIVQCSRCCLYLRYDKFLPQGRSWQWAALPLCSNCSHLQTSHSRAHDRWNKVLMVRYPIGLFLLESHRYAISVNAGQRSVQLW